MAVNQDHYYRIGGLLFRLVMPAFPGSLLSLFEVPPAEPDVTLFFRELPMPSLAAVGFPEAELLYGEASRSYYTCGAGMIRLVCDEHDGLPLFADVPAEGGRTVFFREGRESYFSSHLALDFLDLPRRMLEADAFFLHASWVETEGKALLFTAPKQVGKSTQAALWERYRGAAVINGDRVLLRRTEEGWLAYGSPYCGTSGICRNAVMPVRAIVLLSQAPVSAARRAGAAEGFRALMDGASYDLMDCEALSRMTELLADAAVSLPFRALAATPDEDAVKALEEII